MTPSSAVPPRHRGFSLLEILVSLIVLTLMLAVGVGYLSQRSDTLANQAVAQQMQRIGDAVDAYARDNNSTLTQNISTSPGEIVPLSNADLPLIQAYLPMEAQQARVTKNILQVQVANPLGIKDYYVQLYAVVSSGSNPIKRIRTLVYTTDGLDVSKHAIAIAQMLGAGGFYSCN